MTVAQDYQALRHEIGVADRSDRGFVVVSGPDALSFLQSIVSADLASILDGQGAHTLLLQPQGKLDVDLRLLRVADECWLDAETGMGGHLRASLDRFRIRVKAEVVDRSDEWGMLSVRGPATDEWLPEAPVEQHAHVAWHGGRLVRANWPGAPGVDVIGSRATIAAAREELATRGVRACGTDALEILRIEAGVPRQGLDLDDAVIPQEAFLERDAVSFTKGCYLGQELVSRVDARGHVNRFLRGVRVLEAEPVPPRGARVVFGDKDVGMLTSVASSPEQGVVGLGFVRREVEPPVEVELRWDGGIARAVVQVLPLVA